MTNNVETIRAKYDDKTITVYQAYNIEIAKLAIKNQTFISPSFSKERMTWIKPSFLWMMYRSGWATKKNQEHILEIQVAKSGFETLLENSCLTSFHPKFHFDKLTWKTNLLENSVRIQWDPDRNIRMNPLKRQCIQIGISKEFVESFLSNWIVSICDITNLCKRIHNLILNENLQDVNSLLPSEHSYPIRNSIAHQIGVSK